MAFIRRTVSVSKIQVFVERQIYPFVVLFCAALGRPSYAQPRATTPAHEKPIRAVAVSENGSYFASCDGSGDIHIWDARTRKRRFAFNTGDRFLSNLTYAKDGLLYSVSRFPLRVCLWYPPTGKLFFSKTHSGLAPLAFSPDKMYFIYQTRLEKRRRRFEFEIRFAEPLKPNNVKYVFRGFPSEISAFAITPDGNQFAAGNRDGQIQIWNVPKQKKIRTIRIKKKVVNFQTQGKTVCSLAFSPDGKTLAAGLSFGHIRIWNIADGKVLANWGNNPFEPKPLAFTPDGRFIALMLGLRLWEFKTGKLVAALEGSRAVTAFAFSHDGRHMITGNNAGQLQFWDTPNGKNYR